MNEERSTYMIRLDIVPENEVLKAATLSYDDYLRMYVLIESEWLELRLVTDLKKRFDRIERIISLSSCPEKDRKEIAYSILSAVETGERDGWNEFHRYMVEQLWPRFSKKEL